MGRVELLPRFEASFEDRDPLHQDHRSRSSSDGGSSGCVNRENPLLATIQRTTPTLPEDQVTSMEQQPSERAYPEDSPSQSQSTEQRRLSSALPASSSIVEALFGPGLGPCWGDFSCTYNRIRGRLYATSQAVLFYTNLLGFERRICLLLREIVRGKMELYRTTSLRFATVDGETYIFKSFNDREQVLHLLTGLKILADKQHAEKRQATTTLLSAASPGGTARRGSAQQASPERPQSETGPFSPNNSLSNLPSPQMSFHAVPPPSSNRRRAVSDSIIRLPRVESSGSLEQLPNNQDCMEDTNSIPSDIVRPGEEHIVNSKVEDDEDVPEASMSCLWARAIEAKSPPLQEVGIDGIVLPCDVETFFQTFWADNAVHSVEYYQREYVKDQDIKLTGWDLGSDGYFRRSLQFRHPIQNSLGLGPSSADTTRQQKLRQYTGLGITLENRTQVSGIPAADSFYVQDHWVVEAHGENQVKLTVRYDTRFTKRSMFKSIITKSIRKETKEWMAGYADMVQTVLAQKSPHRSSSNRSVAVTLPAPSVETQKFIRETLESAYHLILVVSVAFFCLGMVACYHIFRLERAVARLHDDLQQVQVCQPPSL